VLALSPGQAGDAPWGRGVLDRFGPVQGAPALVMDRAYHGDATRQLARDLGYRPVVPPPRTRNPAWAYDRVLYRRRNEVERFFCRLKRFRRIATRYDKLDTLFLAFIHLAVIYDALQLT
jgi:transposase